MQKPNSEGLGKNAKKIILIGSKTSKFLLLLNFSSHVPNKLRMMV